MTAGRLLTDLGDFAVAAPAAALMAVWLWTEVDRSLSLVFAGCFAGLVAVVSALKIVAGAAAPSYVGQVWGVSTGAPSGHVALASLVYGGGALVLLRFARGASRIAGVSLGVAAVLTVAVTRVTQRHHTLGDVAAGLIVGAAFTWLFARTLTAAPHPQAPRTAWLLTALVAAPALVLASGLRMPSTAFL